jgi:integrase
MQKMNNLTGFKKYVEPEEIKVLDKWFSKLTDNFRLTYLFMKYMGLRIGDTVTIKKENIQNGHLHFYMHKVKRYHSQPIPKKLLSYLLDYYIPKYEDLFENGYIIYTTSAYSKKKGNEHLARGTVLTEFSKCRKHHNLCCSYHTTPDGRKLHRITPHSLRHNFVEKCTDAGLKDDQIGELTGWKSESVGKMISTYRRAYRHNEKRVLLEKAVSLI